MCGDSGAVMQDFVDDIKAAVRSGGLAFPAPSALKMDLPPDLDWSV